MALILFFLLFSAQAWRGNAFSVEWSGSGDEAAHYVTGLMVHDYIRAGLPFPPMGYAQNYYDHYPKMALGHWPPVYYVIQASWALLFGPGRTSLLLMQCLLAACFFTLSFAVLRRWFPASIVWPVSLLTASTPIVASLGWTLSSELLLSGLVLAALLILERFLDEPTPWLAAWATLFALLAALTKGTAIMLAPLAIVMVTAHGRWEILRLGIVWRSLASLAALSLPWYLLAPGALHERVERFGGLGVAYGSSRWKYTLGFWPDQYGWLGIALILAGVLSFLWGHRQARFRQFGYLALAAPFVLILLRIIIRAWEVRHFVASFPFLMFFLCLGLRDVVYRLGGGKPAIAATALLLAVPTVWQVRAMPPKPRLGIDRVAAHLAATSDPREPLLIVSNAIGEGAFVAEMAMREQRILRRVGRGNKIFITSSFMGRNARANYRSRSELLRMLAALPHRVIVLDDPPGASFFLSDLREALPLAASGWRLEREFPRFHPPGGQRRIQVWTRPSR